MKTGRHLLLVVGLVGVMGVTAAVALGAVSWGSAIEVPGTAALNVGGNAYVNSISCTGAGTCAAGGYYTDAAGTKRAFVAYETSGVWGAAVKVPGTVVNGDAEVTAVSCGAAGTCVAGGYYDDDNSVQGVFVMDATNGAWGAARRVPGTASLKTSNANVTAVSCASAGNGIGGSYCSATGQQVFVAREKNGVGGKAITVPGIAALNTGRDASLTSISCGSPGNCAASSSYRTSRPYTYQAFVVNSKNGVWGKAKKVPGTAALSTGGQGSRLPWSRARARSLARPAAPT